MLQTVVRKANGTFETSIDGSALRELHQDPGNVLWLDLIDPSHDEIAILEQEFGFHPLAVEDAVREHQRPKIDVYPNHYFLVVYAVRYQENAQRIHTQELDLFIGTNYVVTVHDTPMPEIEESVRRWKSNVDILGPDVGALIYALLDSIVDEYFPVIDKIADRVEDLEERIFERYDRSAMESIFELKKDLLWLRRIVAPERDVFNVLLRRDPPILQPSSVIYFQDVYDHIVRVTDSIDTYRDLLSGALDAYLSVVSNNLNEVMKRLTLISTIFLPLSFVVGFFGMNFTQLPFSNDFWLYMMFALLIVIPIVMITWFRRSQWL